MREVGIIRGARTRSRHNTGSRRHRKDLNSRAAQVGSQHVLLTRISRLIARVGDGADFGEQPLFHLGDGESLLGKTLHVAPEYDTDLEDDIRDWFEQYYSIQWRNYPVDASYMHAPELVGTV